MEKTRSQWHNKWGFLVAALGSAIGLGNIWRFSYLSHQYGGSAFLIPFFVALFVAGIPILLLEYGFGHREKGSPPLSFAKIGCKHEWLGWFMTIVAMFGIMLYYAVVIGWCINYLFFSFDLKWGVDTESFFFNTFLQVSDSPSKLGSIRPSILLSTLFVWIICWAICYRDVSHGIEKACIIFMPFLFILTVILCLWTFTLDGALSAIWNNYLKPDMDKILSIDVWRAAFSQVFFTLSLGFGIMITYASYLPEKTELTKNAYLTALIDCGYSVIAGTAVFGTIGFMAKTEGVSFNEAIKSGPQLAFTVYPKAISLLPAFNSLFGVIFFLVLVIAGISSGISLIESFACSLTDKFYFKRKNAVSALCIIGFLGSIIFTTNAGILILDIVDHFITNYGLVIGGIMECLLIGWIFKTDKLRNHINEISEKKISIFWNYLIRYLTPLILILLLLHTIKTDLETNYGGYNSKSIISFGVCWIILAIILSIIFSKYPWKPEKLKREHLPEEDELFV